MFGQGEDVPAPTDYDGIKDRKNDIIYGDKNEYDQKVAIMVGDYIDLFFKSEDIAFKYIPDQNKEAFTKAINSLLNGTDDQNPKSRKRSGVQRTYADLLDKRFKSNKTITIEAKMIQITFQTSGLTLAQKQ